MSVFEGSDSSRSVAEMMEIGLEDRDLFDHVLDELGQIDPASLVLLGLHKNEYEIEAAAICCRLEAGMSLDEIKQAITSEIYQWLDCKDLSEVRVENAARSIQRKLEERSIHKTSIAPN